MWGPIEVQIQKLKDESEKLRLGDGDQVDQVAESTSLLRKTHKHPVSTGKSSKCSHGWLPSICCKDVETLLDFTKRCWIQASKLGIFCPKASPKTGHVKKNQPHFRADQPMGSSSTRPPGNLTPAALRLGENTVTHGKRAIDE